jgi:pimeloyl-ACP methyl ester carboxylesterase
LGVEDGVKLSGFIIYPYPDKALQAISRKVVVLNWNGEAFGASANPLTEVKLFPDLRGQAIINRKSGAIAGAPDHTIAEHAVWIGRPLLALCVADWIACMKVFDEWGPKKPIDLVGIGVPGLAALLAANFAPERLRAVILIQPLVSYLTDAPYASGTYMGALFPGILKVGDIPHLAALVAPRRLVIAGGVTPQGTKLSQKVLEDAFSFTTKVYKAMKASEKLTIVAEPDWKKLDL